MSTLFLLWTTVGSQARLASLAFMLEVWDSYVDSLLRKLLYVHIPVIASLGMGKFNKAGSSPPPASLEMGTDTVVLVIIATDNPKAQSN